MILQQNTGRSPLFSSSAVGFFHALPPECILLRFVILPAVYFRQLLTSPQDRNILFYKGFMQTYSVLISGQNAKQQKRVSRLRP